MDDRTNNTFEGNNFGFAQNFGIHPHIWKFIDHLQEIEASVALDFARLEAGTLRRKPRNKEDIQKDLDLVKLKNKFLQREFTVYDYCQAVAAKMPELGENST